MNEDFFANLRSTLTDTAEMVGKKTGELMENQKLRNRIRSIQRCVTRDYQNLGETIYQRFVDGQEMDEELKKQCQAIMKLQERLAELKEELAGKKGQFICPVCGYVNPKDGAFCMHCGASMQQDEEDEEFFTAGPVQEEDAEAEVWEACTETEDEEEAEEKETEEKETDEATAEEADPEETDPEEKNEEADPAEEKSEEKEQE